MKGYSFYLEYPNQKEKNKATRKKTGNHSGNCIAVYEENKIAQWYINRCYECASAVQDTPNNGVSTSTVSPEYLSEKCKKIGEKQAREIHPALFAYLDYEP